MKVLHVTRDLSPEAYGLSQSVPKLCSSLSDLGLNISILSFSQSLSEAAKESLSHWVKIHTAPAAGVGVLRYLSRHLRELVSGFDIVHSHGIWLPCHWAAAAAAKDCGVPFIVSPHGMLEPWALNHKAWKKKIVWRVIEKHNVEGAAVLHATARQEADSFRKLGLKNSVAVLPNGVDVPELKARHAGKPRTALFLSRVHPVKGLLNLVEAWRRVAPGGWRLVIAGPGVDGYDLRVKAAVKKAGLQDKVSFSGPVFGAAKQELFQGAELFILPTLSENFGLVVAEALAFGLPVITTKAAPWPELETHRCGWWVSPDATALSEALQAAVTLTEAGRSEMGRRGRKLMEESYSWPTVAKGMAGVYEWVLNGGDSPASVLQY